MQQPLVEQDGPTGPDVIRPNINNNNNNLREPGLSPEDEHRILALRPEICRCSCCLGGSFFLFLVLLSICWLTFGSYWVFDTPGAIQQQLTDWFGSGYTNSKNSLLYSIYSFPNCFLAFVGGFVLDRVTGLRVGTVLFSAFILIGQVIFALGVQYKVYWLCLTGRFVFGLGGESLTVAQNTLTTRWFKGPYLAFTFGLVVSFARVGSSVNFIVTPLLANLADGVVLSVWFGALTCLASFLFAALLCVLDKQGDVFILARDQHELRVEARQAVINENDEPAVEEQVKCSDVHHFRTSAWLLMFICLFFYIGVFTFYTVASRIMQNTGREYSADNATLFLSVPNLVSIVMSPVFGRVVDSLGYALHCVLVACLMMIAGHVAFMGLALGWFSLSPVPIMLWLGVGYSLGAAALWPTLSIVVAPKLLGTAYGAMTSVQNIGLAFFPFLIGILQDHPGIRDTSLEYTVPIYIFIACECTAFVLTLLLIGVDLAQEGGRMNMSATARREVVEQEDFSFVDHPPQQPLLDADPQEERRWSEEDVDVAFDVAHTTQATVSTHPLRSGARTLSHHSSRRKSIGNSRRSRESRVGSVTASSSQALSKILSSDPWGELDD